MFGTLKSNLENVLRRATGDLNRRIKKVIVKYWIHWTSKIENELRAETPFVKLSDFKVLKQEM
jgi:hypothetical protein